MREKTKDRKLLIFSKIIPVWDETQLLSDLQECRGAEPGSVDRWDQACLLQPLLAVHYLLCQRLDRWKLRECGPASRTRAPVPPRCCLWHLGQSHGARAGFVCAVPAPPRLPKSVYLYSLHLSFWHPVLSQGQRSVCLPTRPVPHPTPAHRVLPTGVR